MIVGIDQSLTSTGLAFMPQVGQIRLETVVTAPGPLEPRLLTIMREINWLIETAVGVSDFKPKLVVMEGLSAGSFGMTNNVLELAALHYLIRVQLYSQKIPFQVVAPSALKKFVVGSTHIAGPGGKKEPARKEHMLKAVLKRFDIDTQDNNQADAAGLAIIGATISGWREAANQAEREVLEKLAAGPKKKTRKARREV